MKSISKALILALSFGVSNAVAQTVNYSHSNVYATDAQFVADRYQCSRETQQSVTLSESQTGVSVDIVRGTGTAAGGTNTKSISVVLPNCDLFQACLAGRGYTRWDAGALWASPLKCFDANYRRFDFR